MKSFLFAGKTNRSGSPMHAAESVLAPKGSIAYRALCGAWIRTDGADFHPDAPGTCKECSRRAKRRPKGGVNLNAAGFVELSHPTDPRYLMVRGSVLEALPNAPATLLSRHIFDGIYGRPLIWAPEGDLVARYECPDPEAGVWYLRAFVKEGAGRCSKCDRECDPVTDSDSAAVICADCAGAS